MVAKARQYVDAGDLRFAAELLNHAVFADPGHAEAKELLASVYDKLGYGAENGTWRNFYLMGALELRHGAIPPSLSLASPDLIQALTVEQLFDSIAIRVNGPKAWSQTLTIDWNFTDVSSRHRMTLSNGALIHWADPDAERRRPHADPYQVAAAGHARGQRPGRHPDLRATRPCCSGSSACLTPRTLGSRSSHLDGAARGRTDVALLVLAGVEIWLATVWL